MKKRYLNSIVCNGLLIVVIALTLSGLVPARVKAQTTGTIYGTVTDASGAVVSAAAVTVSNVETNLKRTATTDAEGSYSFTLLPVGKYGLLIEARGFRPSQQKEIELQVQDNRRVDFKLAVGDVNAAVVINDEPPQVDTRSATLGKVVEGRRIVELPLNGRNFLQLAVLQPGVVPPVAGIQVSSSGLNNSSGGTKFLFAVNGLRLSSNNFLLDGALNVEPYVGAAMVVPSPDAIQEFRILTNSFSAEFGRAGGAIVTVLTKSGTNSFHGSAFEFLRNDIFDARNTFAPQVPALRQNQFGGTIGGPVWLPDNIFGPLKYDGRSRTFFFFSYEGYRQRAGVATRTTVPSLLERQGNFTQTRDSQGRPVFVKDPLKTGACTATDQTACFAGNVIPDSRIDPVARKVLTLWPEPNVAADSWAGTPALKNDRNQYIARADHLFNKGHDNFVVRYASDRGGLVSPVGATGNFVAQVQVPGFAFQDGTKFQNTMLSETHLFSPSVVNVFRFSFSRAAIVASRPLKDGDPSAFGFTFPQQVAGLPTVVVSGLSAVGDNANYSERAMNFFTTEDNVTIQKGNHSFKAGAEIRRTQINNVAPGAVKGGFQFTGAFSQNPVADFLLGRGAAFIQAGGKPDKHLRQTSFYFFGQDDYKVSSRLSLNLGLRYELVRPFTEQEDLLVVFKPGVQSVVSPTVPVGMLRPGDPGVPKTAVPVDRNNFAPRIGLAWDLFGTGKTSLRAGYGIYFDETSVVLPFAVQQPPDTQIRVNLVALPSFADPFLGNSPLAVIRFPFPVPVGTGVAVLADELPLPYVQQWNLTIQQQVLSNLVLEAAYVGTKGTKLQIDLPFNQAAFQPGATVANSQARRPFQPWGRLFRTENRLNSNYHALQLSANKRYSKGLSFFGSYTWSKSIDYTTLPSAFFNIPGQATRVQDANNLDAERGLSTFDIRHRFVMSYVWELPLLQNRTDLAGKILGGWANGGILTLQSGTPFTVIDSFNPSLNGEAGDRTDVLRDPNLSPDQRTPSRWFDTTAFRRFTPPAFGNAGRNIVFADGVINYDFSLMKNFAISEQKRFEFRWEVFNLFNHPNYGIPVNDFNSATFGRVLRTSTPERQMQFALKFIF